MDLFFKNKRGVFLTLILFLYSLSLVSSLFPNQNNVAIYTNPWINPAMLYYSKLIFDVYFLGGIWLWKKSSVFGKVLLDALVLIIFFFWNSNTKILNESSTFVLIVLILIFIFSDGFLLWAIKRKWQYFS